MAPRSAKSAAGGAASKLGKKTPGKALSTQVRPGAVGYKKVVGKGTKVVGQLDRKTVAKIAGAGVAANAAAVAAGAKASSRARSAVKGGRSRKRRR
jgi:hypothetical protein